MYAQLSVVHSTNLTVQFLVNLASTGSAHLTSVVMDLVMPLAQSGKAAWPDEESLKYSLERCIVYGAVICEQKLICISGV